MREKDFLAGRKSDAPPPASMASISILPTDGYQKLLEAIDRADEMEDAVTLGRDCACHNNDPSCTECWDRPIKFKIVKDHKGNALPVRSQFDIDVRNRFDECLELLLRKHKDYGPANIANAPGGPLNGPRVRLHDKLARVTHLYNQEGDVTQPQFESMRDSFLDLANYSVIALMVLDGAWPSE